MVAPSLAAHQILIGSNVYLPYSAVLQEARGRGNWDSETQVWVLTVGSHELRLTPQMSIVLVDGAPQRVPVSPLMHEGELLLPEILWTKWIQQWVLPPPAQVPSPAPMRLKRIVLDAGHGGNDPGAIGRTGLREKTVTLDIAFRLRDLLEKDGFQVVMTRDNDRFIPLASRSNIANRERADLFVSVHANSSRQRSVAGFEVYTLSDATDDHARALEAAENVAPPVDGTEAVSTETEAIVWDLLYTEHRAESRELAAAICRGLKGGRLPSQNRGVKSARFAVLKGSRMPAILVEVGFISHPAEEARLRTSQYRQRLAEGIHSGILAFKEEYERQL